MKTNLTFLIFLVTFVFGFAAQSSAASFVTVQAGDSMWKIAQRYNVSFVEVLQLNKQHHVNPNLIHVGDKVYLPQHNTGTNTTTHSDNDQHAMGNASAIESDVTSQAKAVLRLVNAERAKVGLKELTLSDKLNSIADTKAKDMAINNYFSHTSPTYGSPFEMLQHFGVTYRAAGENIAAGQITASEVMNSWMNSSGHRANILNANYTELGVGYYEGGKYRTEWVQLFIGK